MEQGVEPPPIEVYQVGEVYFVRDGHTRVSVARHLGLKTIRARVTEVTTRAPVGSEINPEELLRAAEYTRFLEHTQLDVSRPEARLEFSQLDLQEEGLPAGPEKAADALLDRSRGRRWRARLRRRSASTP